MNKANEQTLVVESQAHDISDFTWAVVVDDQVPSASLSEHVSDHPTLDRRLKLLTGLRLNSDVGVGPVESYQSVRLEGRAFPGWLIQESAMYESILVEKKPCLSG